MAKRLNSDRQSVIGPTSQMAFSVALCALTAAGIGLIVNHWLPGWMAVGGMVGVGLFYLVVGIVNLGADRSAYEDEANMNASQRAARSENLIGEAVTRPRVNIATFPESHAHRSMKGTE